MSSTTTNAEAVHPEAEATSYLFDDWFDPIEAGLREQVRGFIETMLETELDAVLARPRYGRQSKAGDGGVAGVAGHRHGSQPRTFKSAKQAAGIIRPPGDWLAGGGFPV